MRLTSFYLHLMNSHKGTLHWPVWTLNQREYSWPYMATDELYLPSSTHTCTHVRDTLALVKVPYACRQYTYSQYIHRMTKRLMRALWLETAPRPMPATWATPLWYFTLKLPSPETSCTPVQDTQRPRSPSQTFYVTQLLDVYTSLTKSGSSAHSVLRAYVTYVGSQAREYTNSSVLHSNLSARSRF